MARSDKTATCPTCGGTFQMRGAGSHFLACAARAGKPAPMLPVVADEPPKPRAPGQAVVRPDPAPKPEDPPRAREVGRPRFHAWKGGAHG